VDGVSGAAPVAHGDGDVSVQQLALRGEVVEERRVR
jgi:hypothetical protein